MTKTIAAFAQEIRSIEGWLELGQVAEAFRLLETIPSAVAAELPVLRLRYTAFAMVEQWNCASLVAEVASHLHPGAPETWLWRAEANRGALGALEAGKALLQAAERFRENKQIARQRSARAETAAAAAFERSASKFSKHKRDQVS